VGEEIARKCEDWRLREELTREWRTVAALGQNSSEGGASGDRRQWSGCGERLGEVWRLRGGPERSGASLAWFENGRSVARQRGKKGGRGGGGPAAGVPHGTGQRRGAWP
jgi:hypothetical protein